MVIEDKGHVSIDDPIRIKSCRRPGRGRWRVKGRGKGRGLGWAEGLLIQRISEESPISNIKDESDRSEDDPGRSKGIRAMTKAKEGRS